MAISGITDKPQADISNFGIGWFSCRLLLLQLQFLAHLFAHFEFLELAADGGGKFTDKLDVTRHLVMRKALLASSMGPREAGVGPTDSTLLKELAGQPP